MKKLLLLFATIIILTSCTESIDTYIISKDFVTVWAGGFYTLSVSGTDNIKWLSSNPFVADVDQDGRVTAHREGTAFITANDLICEFQVNAKYSRFTTPITDWTLTKDQIIARLGEPITETTTSISYKSKFAEELLIMYTFGSDGSLKSATTGSLLVYFDNLLKFLTERYLPVVMDTPSLTAMYIDALEMEYADLIVACKGSNYDGVCISLYTNNSTKSKANEETSDEFIELLNKLKLLPL